MQMVLVSAAARWLKTTRDTGPQWLIMKTTSMKLGIRCRVNVFFVFVVNINIVL